MSSQQAHLRLLANQDGGVRKPSTPIGFNLRDHTGMKRDIAEFCGLALPVLQSPTEELHGRLSAQRHAWCRIHQGKRRRCNWVGIVAGLIGENDVEVLSAAPIQGGRRSFKGLDAGNGILSGSVLYERIRHLAPTSIREIDVSY